MNRKKSSIFDFADFRGGFFSSVPDYLLKANELIAAVNCEWDNGLRKRKGRNNLVTVTGSAALGQIRFKVNASWLTAIAVKTASATTELRWAASSGAEFAATFTYPSGTAQYLSGTSDVHFAVLGEQVVVVNGTDDPRVIYETAGSVYLDTLDRYDTRTRDDANWAAGQMAGAAGAFTDDTTDAQSSASTDFQYVSTSISSGFFAGCDYTFNKVTVLDMQATTSSSFTFEYYGRTTSGGALGWAGFTPLATFDCSAVGNQIIEWDFPIGSAQDILMEKIATSTTVLNNRYAIRMYSNNALTAVRSAQGVAVGHSQYVTQLLLNDKPDTVAEHKNHVFLGSGNWLRISPANSLKGWRYQDYHYFQSGGSIQRMMSQINRLLIILETRLYGLTGTSWANFVLEDLRKGGTISGDSVIAAHEDVFMVAADGIYRWDGSTFLKVSKHIQSDIDGYTLTNTHGVFYKNKCLLSFPTNSVVLVWDPDTFRTDPEGDGRMSFFKWTSYPAKHWSYHDGDGDDGYLTSIVNGTSRCYLQQNETEVVDWESATIPISWYFQTPYTGFGDFQDIQHVRRVKLLMDEVTATGCDTFTVAFFTKDTYGTASVSSSFVTGVGTGYHEEDITIPYTIDGKNWSMKITHAASATARFRGYSAHVMRRRF